MEINLTIRHNNIWLEQKEAISVTTLPNSWYLPISFSLFLYTLEVILTLSHGFFKTIQNIWLSPGIEPRITCLPIHWDGRNQFYQFLKGREWYISSVRICNKITQFAIFSPWSNIIVNVIRVTVHTYLMFEGKWRLNIMWP